MKKVLYGIFVFLFALILIGCGKSDEDKLQEYLEKISIQTEADANFYLPTCIDNLTDHSISWESSNKDVIRIGNMNLSTVGHYGGSVTAIKNALKENLGLKDKEVIKKISFDINSPYQEKVIGKNIYTNKNATVVMGNYIKKDLSVLEKWAKENGYTIEVTEKETVGADK